MKQKVLRIFAFGLLFACILSLVACGGGGNTVPTKLSAPWVTLSGDTASWGANTVANKFEISIDGEILSVENTTTSRKLTNGQTFKIRAIGDGVNYTNSDWSNAVTYIAPEEYTVIWKNGDTVLETDLKVPKGTTPTYNGVTPVKAGYTFIGWTPQIAPVLSDVTYQAQFEANSVEVVQYTVTFKDYDGTVLKTQLVDQGGDATPPQAPSRAGYEFVGWDGSYINIVANQTVTAVYRANASPSTYVVLFKDFDGTVIKTETVESGQSATPPSNPTRQGFRFVGWDKAYDRITEDVEIFAQYERDIAGPAIVVEDAFAKVGDGDVEVVISLFNNPGIASLKFDVLYDESLTLQNVVFDSSFGVYVTAPTPYNNPQPLTCISPLVEVSENGTFATLHFEIPQTLEVGDVLEIRLGMYIDEVYDEDFEPIAFEVINGFVFVVE